MPRQEYQESLSNLRDDVLYMSEVVAERLRLGLDALEQKDRDIAQEVVGGDDEIAHLEDVRTEIAKLCLIPGSGHRYPNLPVM